MSAPEPELPAPSAGELVAEAAARWRAALADLAGASALDDIGALGDAVVDLTAAHPSGIAQLFAGRTTRLSNLFREGASLPIARRHARAVALHALDHEQQYGVPSTYLAIGVATWFGGAKTAHPGDVGALARATNPERPHHVVFGSAEDTVRYRAPVLLRPITITARGSGGNDYDLTLEPSVEVNPVLARTLRDHGALIDPLALARATFNGSGFDPGDVLATIASFGRAVLTDFELTQEVLAGTFVHPGHVLADDLRDWGTELAEHDVVAALAGAPDALLAATPTLPIPRADDAEPARERGVGDLEPSQRHVVDVLATGTHLFVDSPTGADISGTVAAVVAEAAASGRTVLYVPGHRRTAEALMERLAALGLGGLVLDIEVGPDWRHRVSHRLLSAMAVESELLDTDAVARNRDALLGARAQLSGYITSLHLIRDTWGVSAYDALQALARLTAHRPGPATTVRLDPEVALAADAGRRQMLAADLTRAAELGAFTEQANSTSWYGAALHSDAEAREALARVERLHTHTLPQLREQVADVAKTTGLVAATTLRQWGDQLRMLGGMRETLDVFQPMIFERTAQDMVEATASKQWRADHGVDMGWFARRRLRRRAKDMLRPGSRVDDMHAYLIKVQAQRAVWQEQCPRGGWPVLPEGLASIEDTFEAVRIDLDEIAPVLADTPMGSDFIDRPLAQLAEQLATLRADQEDLTDLPARNVLLRRLIAAGLGGLLSDLIARRVPADLVAAELDLAWWSSVFEAIRSEDPALADQDGAVLEALAGRFRELDRAHIDSLSGPVRVATHGHLGAVLRDHPEQAGELFQELLEGRLTSVRDTAVRFPDVFPRLRPVAVVTPAQVPHVLPPSRLVDLVVLDAVEHTPLESTISAIARGRQVVAFGDLRAASTPTLRDLAQSLPRVSLATPASRRDPYLTAYLADHGYAGVLRPAPFPKAEALIHFDVVDGTGMPDPATGAVETTQVEVDRVVEIAIEHAISRPEESFAIVAVTPAHADRVEEALQVEVRRNPALSAFFAASRVEPAVVTDLQGAAGLMRDAICLSIGFGRTPHGRVLHRFGVLNAPGGDALLLDALGAARRRLRVVSTFASADLDPQRLRGRGARMLAEVLELAQERAEAADQVVLGNGVDLGGYSDRLVLDLAERLWRAGLIVETDYGVGEGDRLPLVLGHPDLPGELLVAVLTDDDAYVSERSIRVRDRQLAERLERLGWVVAQVWSAAVFLDPVKEADRLRAVVQAVRDERLPEVGGIVTAGSDGTVVVPVIVEVDDDAGGPRDPDVDVRPTSG